MSAASDHHFVRKLARSAKRPFHGAQRFFSRLVWGRWIFGFLFWETTGLLRWTPWRTLSETVWDVERHHPGTRHRLEEFLLGLTIHIRYRTTLSSSVETAGTLLDRFDDLITVDSGEKARAK